MFVLAGFCLSLAFSTHLGGREKRRISEMLGEVPLTESSSKGASKHDAA
jgi:hypothetical protein